MTAGGSVDRVTGSASAATEASIQRGVAFRIRVSGGAFLVYLAYALGDLWKVPHSTSQKVVGVALVAVFVAVYLGPFAAWSGHPSRRRRLAVVVVMSAIAVTYLLVDGAGGLVFSPYLALAMVTMAPVRMAIATSLLLAAAVTILPELVPSWGIEGQQWAIGAPTVIVTFVMASVRSSTRSRIALSRAQAEVEALAAEQERLRIARDLHDILGHSLTTLALKADLASRLAVRDPAAAQREMEAVGELARQALGDVRSTVAGYREVSLVSELANARQVLLAAGIEADLPASTEELDGDLRDLFGWVVREGVTNMVRHSGASHASVVLGARSIDIVDDGHGPSGAVDGRGLAGLTERVSVQGGSVETGPGPGGRGFRLHVEVPR